MMMMMMRWLYDDGDWVLVMTVSEPGTGTTTSGHSTPTGAILSTPYEGGDREREILTSWRIDSVWWEGEMMKRRKRGRRRRSPYLTYPMVSWRDRDSTTSSLPKEILIHAS